MARLARDSLIFAAFTCGIFQTSTISQAGEACMPTQSSTDFSQSKSLARDACEATWVPPFTLFESETAADTSRGAYWVTATARCFQAIGDGTLGNAEAFFVGIPKAAVSVGAATIRGVKCTLSSVVDGFVLLPAGLACASGADCEFFHNYIGANITDRGGTCIEANAKQVWHAVPSFSQVVTQVNRMVSEQFDGYACLPPSLQTYYACKAIGVLAADPTLFLSKAKTGAEFAQTVKLVTTRVMNELRNGTEIARIGKASLVQKVSQSGALSMEYGRKVRVNGKEVWDVVPIEFNSAMRTIRTESNTVLNDLLEHSIAQASQKKTYFVSVDVNFLSKVNDFNGLHQTGDAYLLATANAMHTPLRNTDVLFRMGGDEFGFKIEAASDLEVQSKLKAIEDALGRSPEIAKIFENEKKFLTQALAMANGVSPRDAAQIAKLEQRLDLVTRARPQDALALGYAPITSKSTVAGVIGAADEMALKRKLERYAERGISRNK